MTTTSDIRTPPHVARANARKTRSLGNRARSPRVIAFRMPDSIDDRVLEAIARAQRALLPKVRGGLHPLTSGPLPGPIGPSA